jgi:OOP family OmpA-OmpF porin
LTVRSLSFTLVCLASAPAVWGQQLDAFNARGIDVVPTKFSPSLNSGLALEGGELDVPKAFLLQAMVDFNFGLMSVKRGEDRLGDLIPFRADVHLMGAYQLHPRVEVSADVPITVAQIHQFGLLANEGLAVQVPQAAGLGNPRLMGRVQLVRQNEWPIAGLVAALEVRAPIGNAASFMADRGFVFAPRLAAERAFGPVRILANVGWRFRTAPGRFMNLYVGHEFTAGAGAAWALPDVSSFRNTQLVGEVHVATPAEAPFTFAAADSLKTPLEMLIGVRTSLANLCGVQLSIGKGLGPSGYGREAFRLVLSISAGGRPDPDDDGDGIPNPLDACPTRPEDFNGIDDSDGCPEAEEPDRDHDLTPDAVDACPDTPGPVDLDGCPDKDGDLIPDPVDKCPDQPGPAALDGCPPPPEEEKVVLEAERIRINDQIQFEFGSAKIEPRSYALLNDVVAVLNKNPTVGPVRIEGHTDNVGPRAFNLNLSKSRAKSVKRYLIDQGVAAERLRSEGFGFDRPVAPNDTALGRAKNRRTEFKVLETEP